MSKKGKLILVLISVVTCIISSVLSILIYSEVSEPSYSKMIKTIVGEDNYKQVSNCDYSFKRFYLYTDGSKIQADSGSGKYEFEEWD